MAQLVVAAAVSWGASAAAGAAVSAGVLSSTGFLAANAAGIGWTIGSMIGGMMFNGGGGEGPRIADKKITSNIYGEMIPWVYGTDRIGTQLVWASDLIESSREEGGKGGGGVTVYSYSINMLVSVCEAGKTPLRIWANGRLIWRNDGTSTGVVDDEIIQPGNVRVLMGEETQTPDPVYEAAVGVNNAVAYRGQLCVMFEGMALDFSANRPPNIEVEVADAVAEGCPAQMLRYLRHDADAMVAGGGVQGDGSQIAAYDQQEKTLYTVTIRDTEYHLDQYDVSGEAPALNWSTSLAGVAGAWGQPHALTCQGLVFDPENRVLWIVGSGGWGLNGGKSVAILYFPDDNLFRRSWSTFAGHLEVGDIPEPDFNPYPVGSGDQGGNGPILGALLTIAPGQHYEGGPAGGIRWDRLNSSLEDYIHGLGNTPYADPDPGDAQWGRTVSAYSATGGVGATSYYVPRTSGLWTGSWVASAAGALFYTGESLTSAAPVTGAVNHPGGLPVTRIAHSVSRARLWVFLDFWVAEIDLDFDTGSPTVYATPFVSVESQLTALMGIFPVGIKAVTYNEQADRLVIANMYNGRMWVVHLDPVTYAITDSCVSDIEDESSRMSRLHHVGNSLYATAFANTASGDGVALIKGPGGYAYGEPAVLGDIVEDLCVRSGLTQAQIDRSTLTDLVDGFSITRRAPARSAIDQLRSAWFFDAVESGEVLKWVKRGSAAVATIDAGELGARVWSSESTPEPALEVEHVNDTERPRELSVSYVDAFADYDPGVQTARRQAVASVATAQVELPIVMSAEYAGRVAWVNLLSAWVGDRVKWKLSHQHERIEPTDAILLPFEDGPRRVVVESKTSARPLLEFEGRIEDASIYDLLLDGSDREQGPRTDDVSSVVATILHLLDLPPLRDEDDTQMLYAAAAPATSGTWRGAALFKSIDSGASYSSLVSMPNAATIGALTAPLPAWTRGNVFDRSSVLRVRLISGTLSSATELAVLNGANAAAVGSEIVQWVDATLVGTNEWELSTLLRHRLGTEWAAASERTAGTRFVVLDSATLRAVPYPLGEIGATRQYKGVSAGRPVSDTAVTYLVASGNSIKPLSADHIRGARDAGDLTITWIPRARIAEGWRSGAAPAIDEPVEIYEIDILDGSTVVRTLTASSPTASYTAAQQATDFGAPQSSVSVAIYQISSRIGRGHAGRATI